MRTFTRAVEYLLKARRRKLKKELETYSYPPEILRAEIAIVDSYLKAVQRVRILLWILLGIFAATVAFYIYRAI